MNINPIRAVAGAAVISFLLISMPGAGLEVDVDEIRTKRIEFINYQGRNKKADPIREIEKIGKDLARDSKERDQVRFHMKYSIIRAVSKDEPEKFSSDIFSIDKDARVGHINAIRRITTAYLMERYGYSRTDATTLSLFLSFYNAVHRGDTAYLAGKYKSVVMNNITARNAGISTKYWEWPGATKMLIPLTEQDQKGKLEKVDPDLISDKKTIDQLRKDDKNLKDRENMTDLRDKKLDTDKKELKEEKKKIEEEKKKTDDEKKDLVKKKEETRKKEEELKKEKEETKKIIEQDKRKEKEKEIEKKEKKLDEDKKETKKKEETIKKKEETVKKKEQTIPDKEKKIIKREDSIKDEKKQIEKDKLKKEIKEDPEEAKKKLEEKEKELDKREDKLRDEKLDKNIYGTKLYYMKIKEYLEGGHYNNDMYMIGAETRKVLFKSPVENICGSRYDVFSGGVVIITHKGSHTAGHRLTLVDKDTLAAKINGGDDVFWRSFIEIREGFIYAITYDGGKFYLGKFDSALKLVAKSKEEISENTFISFWDTYVYINRQDKKIIVLNKNDLTLIDEVKP